MSSARKYPDPKHMLELEEELGFRMDREFIEGQRAALRRIQSERLCFVRENLSHQSEGTVARSISSISACGDPGDKATKDQIGEFHLSPDEILEQRRIYEQIQAKQQNSKPSSQDETTEKVVALKPIQSQVPSWHPSSTTILDDRVECLRNGRKIRISSERQVYRDISRGDAILINCINCASFLQVGKKTVNVFCTVCQSISPVNCEGLQSISPRLDLELSSALQIQENDAVRARLKEKLALEGRPSQKSTQNR